MEPKEETDEEIKERLNQVFPVNKPTHLIPSRVHKVVASQEEIQNGEPEID